MQFLTTVPAFILALAILIVVHELGHYWVARRCGVKVLRFSVGFGQPLWRRARGPDRTEWVVSAIPFGGYVRMLDENDPDCQPIAPEDLPRAFNRQSVGRRAAIVLAGPLANLLLAVLLYWALNLAGTLEPVAYLGPAPAGSPAAAAGAADGDLVLACDGREVRAWGEMQLCVVKHGMLAGSDAVRARLEVLGVDGVRRSLDLDLSALHAQEVDEAWFAQTGLVHGGGPPVVRALDPQGAALKAGLAVGDRIVSIDGEPVATSTVLTQRVRAADGSTQHWLVERDGRRIALDIAPPLVTLPDGSSVRRVGIDMQAWQTVRYGPWQALVRAGASTWDTSAMSVHMVVRMIEGRSSWHNVSGALTVADFAGQAARIGLAAYLSFLAFVSISLGVLNLMPIPVLDGGLLLYYAVEIVKGSPLSVRTVAVAQRVGVAVLVLLTVLALYNDLTRLLS